MQPGDDPRTGWNRLRIPLGISLLLHIAIIVVAVLRISAPEELKAPPQEALPVEIIDIEDISRRTAMRKDAPEPPEQVEKPAPPKPEPVKEPAKPTPKPAREVKQAAREQAPAPVPKPKPEPKPEPQPKPEPEPEPAPSPKAEKALDELVKKVAEEKPKAQPKPNKPLPKVRPRPRPRIARQKPKPPPKKPVKVARRTPETPQRDPIDDIAALLNKTDDERRAPPPPSEREGTPLRGPADINGDDARIAADIADALRRRIEECWNIPAGVRDAQHLRVRIRFQLGPGGEVTGGPEVLNNINHPAFPAAAQSAVRAVLACQPYAFLPPDRYDLWKDVILTFDPAQMLAGY